MPHDRTYGRWFAWERAVVSDATGTVCHMEQSNPNRDNDQQLILAAPDMLAALRLVQGVPLHVDIRALVDAAVNAATVPPPPRSRWRSADSKSTVR